MLFDVRLTSRALASKEIFFYQCIYTFFLFLFLLYVRFLRILFVDVRLMYLIAFLVAF